MAAKANTVEDKYTGIYVNRELSWLKFNERVLEEAENEKVPLCERMSFLSIYQSNLDEFFMVRVGSLEDMKLLPGDNRENKTNMTPQEQIDAILKRVNVLNDRKDTIYTHVMELVAKEGVHLVSFRDLSKADGKYLEDYFRREVLPLLSLMIVGRKQPFPFLKGQEIYAFAILGTKSGKEKIGIIPCGSEMIPRLIPVPGLESTYMLLEGLILHFLPTAFSGYKVLEKSVLRVTRNADIDVNKIYDEDLNYRDQMAQVVKLRKKLAPVRLELTRDIAPKMVDTVCNYLELTKDQVFYSKAPLDLSFLFALEDVLRKNPDLVFPKRLPQSTSQLDSASPVIPQILDHDVLLSYPYESIRPFLNMLSEAANDPKVVSIRMTLYRLAKNSKVVEALVEAAENGKQVDVLVELKARFDEENNINWAKKLEKAGCHVIYGLVGLKTHCKITLVVRREEDGIRRYVHLGTGNYNDSTAKLYTDCGLITCHPLIGEDATAVFNMLSGYSEPPTWNRLILAPLWLRKRCVRMIRRETMRAREGKPAHIMAKMNSLCDREIIACLYEASCAGVKIELVVRGICCLKAGVPGLSENISVHSIVGNFLEHARIFYFENGGSPEVYMGSADWMPRNLDRRVELVFPVEDEDIKKRVQEVITVSFKDTVNARQQLSTGVYKSVDKRGKHKTNCQKFFSKLALKAQKQAMKKTYASTVGTPIVPVEVKKEDSER